MQRLLENNRTNHLGLMKSLNVCSWWNLDNVVPSLKIAPAVFFIYDAKNILAWHYNKEDGTPFQNISKSNQMPNLLQGLSNYYSVWQKNLTWNVQSSVNIELITTDRKSENGHKEKKIAATGKTWIGTSKVKISRTSVHNLCMKTNINMHIH